MQRIWTVGIIPICLVWKIGGEGNNFRKKIGFLSLKSTDLSKWDNFYFQHVRKKNTKLFFLGNFFRFPIFFAKNWKKLIFDSPPPRHPKGKHFRETSRKFLITWNILETCLIWYIELYREEKKNNQSFFTLNFSIFEIWKRWYSQKIGFLI